MAETDTLYNKLPKNSRRFRLLTILPNGDQTATVECTLMEKDIDEAKATYDALFYCWGDASLTVPAIVNGHTKRIIVNLDDALRQLRADAFPEPMIIWADALCINQDDTDERGHQVKLMGDIYRKGSKVRAWLGRGGYAEERGLRAIEHMARRRCDKDDDRAGKTDPAHKGVGHATWDDVCESPFVSAVCALPYWQRVWIIQELVLNDKVILHSGARQAPVECWDCLLAVNLSCLNYFGGKKPLFGLISLFENCPSAQDGVYGMRNALDVIIRAKRRGLHKPDHITHLLMVFIHVRTKIATNELDRMYGLLGLLEGDIDINVDYNASVESLYKEVVFQLIQRTGSPEILRQAVSQDKALPSWVPDFSARTDPYPFPGGPPNYEHRRFLPKDESFNPKYPCEPCGDMLQLCGVDFDTVEAILESEPIIARMWQKFDTTNESDITATTRQLEVAGAWEVFKTRRGFWGMLKGGAKIGDHVCFLAAQSACMIFVLRKTPTYTSIPWTSAWALVGGCTIWPFRPDSEENKSMSSLQASEILDILIKERRSNAGIFTSFFLV